MAAAMISGIASSGLVASQEVLAYDIDAAKAKNLQARWGIEAIDTCSCLIEKAEVIVLAVKPNTVAAVLHDYRQAFAGKAVISIAAGWTTEGLQENLDSSTRVLRAMPNTPAMVGEGMIALSNATTFTNEEKNFAHRALGAIGKVIWAEEAQMDAITGLSGSGPAYAYMFIEAMADAGVASGLTRKASYQLAAQTLIGSAKMVLEGDRHPGELKDAVCSPGGTTIAGVHSLEQRGFRGVVMDAVLAGIAKAIELEK